MEKLLAIESAQILTGLVKAAPQIELETNHFFSGGLYARELVIPAGTVLVGKVHLKDGIFTVSKGKISVYANGSVSILEAPFTGTSFKGTARIGYAHTDTVFTTYHCTGALSIGSAEDDLVVEDYDSYLARIEAEMNNKLEGAGS